MDPGGEKVYITGSFTGWRKMIGLAKQPDNSFLITLGLPIGTHRFRFVIDNELRFSDFLPTATDQMGNFVNYVEVTPEHVNSHLEKEQQKQLEEEELQQKQQAGRKSSVSSTRGRSDSMWGLTNDDDDMGNGYSRYHDGDSADSGNNSQAFISDIPQFSQTLKLWSNITLQSTNKRRIKTVNNKHGYILHNYHPTWKMLF